MIVETYLVNYFSKIFLLLYKLNKKIIDKEVLNRCVGYLDKTVIMHHRVHIAPKHNAFIYENVNIAPFVQTWANAEVIIGSNTLIASYTIIATSTDYGVEPIRSKRIDKKITIGEDFWIGSGAIIFHGVTIGDGAIIGAESLVNKDNKDVESYSVHVGIPAFKIKNRFTTEGIK